MRKRAHILTVVAAVGLCLFVAGGAAYALAPSIEAARTEANAVMQEQAEKQFQEDFASVYEKAAAALEVCGQASPAEESPQPQESPSVYPTTAHEQSAAKALTQSIPVTPCSLVIFDNVIPYVDAFKVPVAPATTAGLWAGSDATTDGSWGYFIGHHPGIFNCVMYLSQGDVVQVCDRNGNTRTYTVFAVYNVPDSTEWNDISQSVTSHGESITLQTCVGDHATYRIVQAA